MNESEKMMNNTPMIIHLQLEDEDGEYEGFSDEDMHFVENVRNDAILYSDFTWSSAA